MAYVLVSVTLTVWPSETVVYVVTGQVIWLVLVRVGGG